MTDKYLFFFGHTQNKSGYHILSQWYPVTFSEKLDGANIVYHNAEQYMMAQKAILFGDSVNFNKIMQTPDPKKVKALGRLVENFDPEIWDEHKFEIVVHGNRLKFGQNPGLMSKLLQSGDKIIVEASPYDRIWGIGLRADQAAKIPEKKWPGSNLLGKALMVVREENKN